MRADTAAALNEWLAEIEAAQSGRSDEGMTTAEIAAAKGWTTRKVLQALRAAGEAGRLKVGRRMVAKIDGISAPKPVYRILPAKPKAKK